LMPTKITLHDFRKIAHIFYFGELQAGSAHHESKYNDISFYVHGEYAPTD
jgi:hypothetical protein